MGTHCYLTTKVLGYLNYHVYPGQASPLPGQDLTPEDMLETRRERDVDNYHYVYQDDDDVYQDDVGYLEPQHMRRKREGVDSLPVKTKRDDEARLVEGHRG